MQWIECERCLHISPNPNGQQAPMTQPSKTAHLFAGCETVRVRCDDGAFKPPPKKAPKPLCIADLVEEVQASATDCESTPSRIRTCDLRIRSPLLYPTELWAPRQASR